MIAHEWHSLRLALSEERRPHYMIDRFRPWPSLTCVANLSA
jgi:hypothetical protein